jgi:hypothetical protein
VAAFDHDRALVDEGGSVRHFVQGFYHARACRASLVSKVLAMRPPPR